MRFFIMLMLALFVISGCGDSQQAEDKTKVKEQSEEVDEQSEDEPSTASSTEKETSEHETKEKENEKKEQENKPIDEKDSKKDEGNHSEATSVEQNQTNENNTTEEKATAEPSAESSSSKNKTNELPTEEKRETILFSIRDPHEKGVILERTKVEVEDDDTVLDCLIQVAKANNIQFSYRGRGASAYVEGIDNLYEFDRGPGSGWMYQLNGTFKSQGAGKTTLTPGDTLEWVYTENMGQDIGAN